MISFKIMHWWRAVLAFFLINTGLVLLFASIWHGIQSYSCCCLNNINTFSDSVLLSIEIHSTIGFGGRSVSGKCILNIFVLLLQHCITYITNGMLLTVLLNELTFKNRRQKKKQICKELESFHPPRKHINTCTELIKHI